MIRTVEYNQIKWHHIYNPSKSDMKFLEDNFHFHKLNLDDVMSYQQRPKIDTYDNYVFLVMHFPILEGSLKLREVDFFIGSNYIITTTNTNKKYDLLENLFTETQNNPEISKKLFEGDAKLLFYHLLDKFIGSIFPIINQLGAEIDTIDTNLIKHKITYIIEKINLMRRNLIILHTLIKPELGVLYDIEQGKVNFLEDTMSVYWRDLLDHLRKISDQVDDYQELIEGIAKAGESLISHRTNEIIKILTIFSVIVLPLNLLASIYGMNILLPIQKSVFALPVIIFVMLAIVGGMMIYFKIKKWS